MIKKLNILNFQSHKDTSLEFAPGVNVIVGASDSGKSAIIRALRWLIWNRPVGDAFRSHWGGPTGVSMSLENGSVITRGKSDSSNVYKFDSQTFKAFGNDVPQPIQEILNLDETNLQRQGDSPFLISSTAGEVSGYFNRIAKLDKIDSSLKFITSQAKALTNQIKSDEIRVQSLEAESKQYEYLGQAETRLEILEGDLKAQNQRRSSLTTLTNLRAELHLVEHDLLEEQHTASLESNVTFILEAIAKKASIKTALEDLEYGAGMLKSYDEAIQRDEAYHALLEPVNNTLHNYQKRDEALATLENLKDMVEEFGDIDNAEITLGLELRDHEERFHQLMPDVCPLCGK